MTKTALVTGANGRIGRSLLPVLKEREYAVIALDREEIAGGGVDEKIQGSVLDKKLLDSILGKDIKVIFHLASTLAITSELNPEEAHEINATGTVNVYSAALKHSAKSGKSIQVVFPSSIAVYGLPDTETRNQVVVTENEYCNPQTIYGITKLYCEQLGMYYADRYQLLAEKSPGAIDFRALRFPGIIAEFGQNESLGKYAGLTMIHSPAEGGGFEMYIKEDTILPFITMDDAVHALIALSEAPKEKLTMRVYNVSGFAATAKELGDMINNTFPDSQISENFDVKRQQIVDTWPQAVDDSKAREDWGWNPKRNNLEGNI